MNQLQGINTPADLKTLTYPQMDSLASEIRDFLIEKVSATGGHLGPNLGVVELTLAVHRVFDSPRDPILFDTGHQSYVHKLVTGRREGFDLLRQAGGLSGYPSTSESRHDLTESSHASASLSYADGIAKALDIQGQKGRHVVTIIGDGAMTGGMTWEALNNIAAGPRRSHIIIINDNGRSYSETIGGWADHLEALRMQPAYERALDRTKKTLTRNSGKFGRKLYAVLHALKTGLRDAVIPQHMFGDLGIKYLGPVDGHDQRAMESALTRAKNFGGPVIVHAVTRKGRGYLPAENDAVDQMHSTGVIDPRTGKSRMAAKRDWTSVFSSELLRHGSTRDDIVAITAAMAVPTGVYAFGQRYPDRLFDVGIAEQHAVTSAAGLAIAGMHPVVALYSTFLNRAFDQVLMDVGLLSLPVTFVLDRSGVTGPDGASHNGMWDLSILGIVPGMRVAAPRDPARLREEFSEALSISDGPSAIRFPKGAVEKNLPEKYRLEDGVDILREGNRSGRGDVLLISVGTFAQSALDIASRLAQQGISATVVDPRWVFPIPSSLIELAKKQRLIVTYEDSGIHGGFGSTLGTHLNEAEVDTPLRQLAISQEFLEHGTRNEVLAHEGLDSALAAQRIISWYADITVQDDDPSNDITKDPTSSDVVYPTDLDRRRS